MKIKMDKLIRQKFLYLCFIIIILLAIPIEVNAQTIEVMSLTEFSTAKPPTSIKVRLMEPLSLDKNTILESGAEITGNLIDVVSPKRLKRDANFSFQPITYCIDGKTVQIEKKIKASYTEPLDKGQIARNTALGVGNFFIKGLSTGVNAVKGAIENEEDNRLKSSVVSAYESSPISYIEKGENIEIKNNEIFYLKFPKIKK